MDNNILSTAISILLAGICFLIVTDVILLRDLTGLGKRKAQQEFPIQAEAMGFHLKEKTSSGDIGEYTGKIGSYQCRIRSDYGAEIIVQMPPIKGLTNIMNVGEHRNKYLEDKNLITAFPYFETDRLLTKKINQSQALKANLLKFNKKWHRTTEFIDINNDYIRVSFKYGMSTYIPAGALKEIIPDLLTLTDTMQQELRGKTTL
jgi:hypothetical protein